MGMSPPKASQSHPYASFGGPPPAEPQQQFSPLAVAPIQLPVVLVVDQKSLEALAMQVAGAVAQAVYDGIAAGIDPAGDDIEPGPRPGGAVQLDPDPMPAQLGRC